MSFSLETIRETLSARAGQRWEIYAKRATSTELRVAAPYREESERFEDGFAARWDEKGRSYFAAGSSPALLIDAIHETARLSPADAEPLPALPAGTFPQTSRAAPLPVIDAFEEVAQLLASESKGQSRLTSLTVTRGRIVERIENGAGFAGGRERQFGYGNARAIGIATERRVTADIVFPVTETGFDVAKVAQSLADRSLLPLKGRACPFPRGELLLDPSISAAILAETLPLFCGDRHRPLLSRRYLDRSGRFCADSVSLIDDPAGDGPFDAEGVASVRKETVSKGIFRTRLHDLASAKRADEPATGNAVRPSFRTPPRPGSSLFQLESASSTNAADLLASVTRGLYATALSAPPRVDLENDTYRLEVEGWALQGGRLRSPVAAAVLRGRLTEFWRGIGGVGTDRRTFPLQTLIAAPTLFLPKASFS
jgi:predicted Zn-dependent protease